MAANYLSIWWSPPQQQMTGTLFPFSLLFQIELIIITYIFNFFPTLSLHFLVVVLCCCCFHFLKIWLEALRDSSRSSCVSHPACGIRSGFLRAVGWGVPAGYALVRDSSITSITIYQRLFISKILRDSLWFLEILGDSWRFLEILGDSWRFLEILYESWRCFKDFKDFQTEISEILWDLLRFFGIFLDFSEFIGIFFWNFSGFFGFLCGFFLDFLGIFWGFLGYLKDFKDFRTRISEILWDLLRFFRILWDSLGFFEIFQGFQGYSNRNFRDYVRSVEILGILWDSLGFSMISDEPQSFLQRTGPEISAHQWKSMKILFPLLKRRNRRRRRRRSSSSSSSRVGAGGGGRKGILWLSWGFFSWDLATEFIKPLRWLEDGGKKEDQPMISATVFWID